MDTILQTIHSYPTMSEACKATAGYWRKKQTNPRSLSLLNKIFSWQRKTKLNKIF